MSKTCPEGPAEQGQMFKPGGAEKLPTKHYPSSGNLGKTHKEVIEGPAPDNGIRGGYHK